MIILEIDIEDVALITVFEAEGQAPIAADRHRESAESIAVEGMKSARTPQVAGANSTVDRVEQQAHALLKFWTNIARLPGTKHLFYAFVREPLNSHSNNSEHPGLLPPAGLLKSATM
jgi:hypothetical protein